MTRFLILVPRMPMESELMRLAGCLPEDYHERYEEFWGYVEERLAPFIGRISRVYCEGLDKGGEQGLAKLAADPGDRGNRLLRRIVERGGVLEATEDPVLFMESLSWLEQVRAGLDLAKELLQENMRERDAYISRVVDATLNPGETGVMLIGPGHSIDFPAGLKMIKMQRFDPGDYVEIWMKTLELRKPRSDKV